MSGAGGGAIRELFAVLGFQFDDKGLNEAESKIDQLANGLKKFGVTLGAGALIKGALSFAENLAAVGDRLDAQSHRLGLNTDSLQEFEYAAEQAGASAESFAAALLQLQDRQGDALRNKTGENAKTFKRLGIAFKDANGQAVDSETLFLNVADAISKLPSDAAKANAAVDAFGRQGKELLPALKEGRAGLEAYRRKFKELGGGYDKEAVKASDDFGDSQKSLALAFRGIGSEIAKRLLPLFTKLFDFGARLAARFKEFAANSRVLEVALGTLGVVIGAFAAKALSALAPLALPFLKLALLATAAYLVFEDIYYFLTGRGSAIGDIINEIFGAGADKEVLNWLKQTWEDISDAIRQAVSYIRDLNNAIDQTFKAGAENLGNLLAKLPGVNTNPRFRGYDKAPIAANAPLGGGGQRQVLRGQSSGNQGGATGDVNQTNVVTIHTTGPATEHTWRRINKNNAADLGNEIRRAKKPVK